MEASETRHLYVPLKCQTHYSVLRSCVKIDELIEFARSCGHRFLAICDHNTLSGYYEFYKKCSANGIKPIIGVSVDLSEARSASGSGISHRITLYCKNNKGLLNLFRILNKINLSENSSGAAKNIQPFGNDIIFEYSEGLICSFPSVSSMIYKLAASEKNVLAEKVIGDYLNVFGAERLYFELWKDGVAREDEANLLFLQYSKKYGIKPLAVNNCQYLNQFDRFNGFAAAYAIRNSVDLETARARVSNSGHFHFKSDEEIREAFSHIAVAVENAYELAFSCNVEAERPGFLIPEYVVPEGFTQSAYLSFLAKNSLETLKDVNLEVYLQRLERELKIIDELNFSSYFLCVRDIVKYARDNGIPVGPGRGSACSSLTCYLLDITRIDPIENQLMFERFMNPGRVKMPDIDIDFASSKRYAIIDYIAKKYGKNRVAQIITFNHFKQKALFNALCKIMNVGENLVKDITPLFNRIVSENPEMPFVDIFKNGILNKFYLNEKKISELCAIAPALLNNIRQASIHAGGIVISPNDISQCMPLARPNGEINVTALDMNALNELGYLKIDLLGINALEKIELIKEAILKSSGVDIDIEKMPLDDKKTFELISCGETYGIFQLETPLFRKFLPRIAPGDIKELAIAIALIRPGPIQGNIVQEYVLRKSGRSSVIYQLEAMKDILKETRGLIVFQEQIMRIATDVFGYDHSEADIFREIMSKKAGDKIEDERSRFIERAKRKKIDAGKASEIFELIAKFAQYGFNKAHSAAYSRVAYYMAYYMANYPLEYIMALLNNDIRNRGVEYNIKINFLRRCRIGVYPLDINKSTPYYSVENNSGQKGIRHGFLTIAGISLHSVEAMVAEREKNGFFLSADDFSSRMLVSGSKIKINELESLVKLGAFDSIASSMSRERIISTFQQTLFSKKNAAGRNESIGQITFSGNRAAPLSGPGLRKFMPPAKTSSELFLDSERAAVLKHINLSSISKFIRDSSINNESGRRLSFGEIVSYDPVLTNLLVKDPFDAIGEYAFKLMVPEALMNKINLFSAGITVFFEFETKKGVTFISDDNLESVSPGMIHSLISITSYQEASFNFRAYVKINMSDVDSQQLTLVKRITERHSGSIPLYIKTNLFTIATNKKVNFSESFIREIKSVEKLSANVEIYIDYK